MSDLTNIKAAVLNRFFFGELVTRDFANHILNGSISWNGVEEVSFVTYLWASIVQHLNVKIAVSKTSDVRSSVTSGQAEIGLSLVREGWKSNFLFEPIFLNEYQLMIAHESGPRLADLSGVYAPSVWLTICTVALLMLLALAASLKFARAKVDFMEIAVTIMGLLCYQVEMPKKKKNQLANLHKGKKAPDFKVPNPPSEKSASSRSSSTVSAHTSIVGSESSTVRTRSQMRREENPVNLPAFVPVDIVGWQKGAQPQVAEPLPADVVVHVPVPTLTESSEGSVTSDQIGPRKRGRPRKYIAADKEAQPQVAQVEPLPADDSVDAPVSIFTESSAGSVVSEQMGPRKRGRPRKNAEPEENSADGATKSDGKNTTASVGGRPKKSTRKGGRRVTKVPTDDIQATDTSTGTNDPEGPRKRGRPRKFVAKPFLDGHADRETSSDRAEVAWIEKRGRGRPRKAQQIAASDAAGDSDIHTMGSIYVEVPVVNPPIVATPSSSKSPITATKSRKDPMKWWQKGYSESDDEEVALAKVLTMKDTSSDESGFQWQERRYDMLPPIGPRLPPVPGTEHHKDLPYGERGPKDTRRWHRKKTTDPRLRCPTVLKRQYPFGESTSRGKRSRFDELYQARMGAENADPSANNHTRRRRSARAANMPWRQPAVDPLAFLPITSSSSEPTQGSVRDPDYAFPDRLARAMNLPRPGRMPRQAPRNREDPDYRHPTECPPHVYIQKDKTFFWRAVREGTFNIARGPLPPNVERYSVGKLGDLQCSNCLAPFFRDEVMHKDLAKKLFVCCQRGKLLLPDAPPYPEHLKRLLDVNKPKLRLLNSKLAIAGYEVRRVPIAGWPYVYKILGQVHVQMNHAEPLPDPTAAADPATRQPNVRDLNLQKRKNGQLSAFVDPVMATGEILKGFAGDELDGKVVQAFLEYLHTNNAHYQACTRMEALIAEQEAQGQKVEVTLVFKNPGQAEVNLREHTHRKPVFSNEVAALFDVGGVPDSPNIYILQYGTPFKVLPTHPFRDAFVYPLMYLHGLQGWHFGMKHQGPNATAVRNRVTLREYMLYVLYRRSPLQIELSLGALTQQFIVDSWVRVQSNDLNFIKSKLPQNLMVTSRAHLAKLLDRIAKEKDYDVGRSFVLPTSHRGGAAHMETLYRHCIESLRKTGIPTAFITMTANPNDPDILSHPDVRKGDGSLNSDVVNRVFKIKANQLRKDLKEGKIHGNVTNCISVTEFQKRGLPHVHMVVTYDKKLETPDDVDSLVTCEMPDPDTDPVLYERVTKYMLHNCNNRCQDKNGHCKKGFPHNYREETVLNDGKGWIGLRRPRGGPEFKKGGKTYDSRHVVPYNPYLLMRYDCHINVLPFNNLRQARYLFKYICKGVDCATVEKTFRLFDHIIRDANHPTREDLTYAAMRVVPQRQKEPGVQPSAAADAPTAPPGDTADQGDPAATVDAGAANAARPRERSYVLIDEVSFTQDMQYLTASEAHWHLAGFPMHYSMFNVVELSVHLKGQENAFFKQGQALQAAKRLANQDKAEDEEAEGEGDDVASVVSMVDLEHLSDDEHVEVDVEGDDMSETGDAVEPDPFPGDDAAAPEGEEGGPPAVEVQASVDSDEEEAEAENAETRNGHRAATDVIRRTPLTAYFHLNKTCSAADREILQNMTFVQLPERFRFDTAKREWVRKLHCNKPTIGSLYPVSPKHRECFYLRGLLQKVKCPTSYKSLLTVNGETHVSFRDAAVAMGLARDDAEFDRCLQEASLGGTAFAMRLLFVTIVLHCCPTDPRRLLDDHWEAMAGPHWTKERLMRYLARKIALNNAEPDKQLFEGIDLEAIDEHGDQLELDEGRQEFVAPTRQELDAAYASLNDEQRGVFDRIVASVNEDCRGEKKNRIFLVHGIAGCGKTTTYNALHDHLMAEGKKVVCVSYTGMAASLLPGGKTLHSAFGLPVPLNKDSVSRLQPHMDQYAFLQDAKLLIIDECSMAPVHACKVAEQVMRRVRHMLRPDDPMFGGLNTLMGGDFRQCAPVPGDNEVTRDVALINSEMVELAEELPLTTNMRTDPTELEFSRLQQAVGEGRQESHPSLPPSSLMLPNSWVVESGELQDLLDWCFGDQYSINGAERAILTHTNQSCTVINHKVISLMPGELVTLYSEDSICDDDPENPLMDAAGAAATFKTLVTPEELHSETPMGMPHHELLLKIGAIVMLIRNLDVSSGLVNGLRLRVVSISRYLVRAEAISGGRNIRGRVVDLSRIDFDGDLDSTIRMRRTQFPLRLAFGMTINKAQGLTLQKVGVYLPRYLSDHGKLYVALSRVRRSADLKFIVHPDSRQGYSDDLKCWYTHNPVRRELWDLSLKGRAEQQDEFVNRVPAVYRADAMENVVHVPAEPDDALDVPAPGANEFPDVGYSEESEESHHEEDFLMSSTTTDEDAVFYSGRVVVIPGIARDIAEARLARGIKTPEQMSQVPSMLSPISSPTKTSNRPVPQTMKSPQLEQIHLPPLLTPLTSPVVRTARDTPTSSPVMGVPQGASPTLSALLSSPEMPQRVGVRDSPVHPRLRDLLDTKVHDTRKTMSQQSPAAPALSQESNASIKSLPAMFQSAMQMKTLDEDELCSNPNCYFCVKAKMLGISDLDVYLGSEDPQFDLDYEELQLLPDPAEF